MPIRVFVTSSKDSDGIWRMVVKNCPYCKKQHVFKGGMGENPLWGLKHAHCNGLPLNLEEYPDVNETAR
jgi:hypothetical protein